MHKELLVETHINDSSDYDHLVEQATQNTLAPYFEFKDDNNIDVSYEKSYGKSGYGLLYKIHAVFIDKNDLALFRLRFAGDYPKTKFKDSTIHFVI